MRNFIIGGIQQVGIGVNDLKEAWNWYIKFFGIDCPIFQEKAEAKLMLPFTGGEVRARHAVLAYNLQSGGGFEIWQHTSRTPQFPTFRPEAGNLGIFVCKIKTKSIGKTFRFFMEHGVSLIGEINWDPEGKETFFLEDPFGNIFQIVEAYDWFMEEKKPTGGVYGTIIGVTNIEKAREVYSEILGYDRVVYDVSGSFGDFAALPGGKKILRRVLLRRSLPVKGPFSRLMGVSEIELISSGNRDERKIYENRQWGDPGFIHLCYDINGMENLKNFCTMKGFPFEVDSRKDNNGGSFDMGEAAGHFAYIQDPDGNLIEFVETHKIPVIKKIGWYLNLRKRNPENHLPDWMLKVLKFSRVRKA